MRSSSRNPTDALVQAPPCLATPSRAQIEQAMIRGRRLQGEALRAASRALLRTLAARLGLRVPVGLIRRQPCC